MCLLLLYLLKRQDERERELVNARNDKAGDDTGFSSFSYYYFDTYSSYFLCLFIRTLLLLLGGAYLGKLFVVIRCLQ